MKYVDYKAKQHKEFNKLPMKAAFGDKQFEEMMAEWGLTTSKEDLEKNMFHRCRCLLPHKGLPSVYRVFRAFSKGVRGVLFK